MWEGGAFGDTYAGEKLGMIAGKTAANSTALSLGRTLSEASDDAFSETEGMQLKKQEAASNEVESKFSAKRKRRAAVDPFAAGFNQSLKKVQQAYRVLEQTKEWAENNYYHLPQR